METKYLGYTTLSYFLTKLKEIFGLKTTVVTQRETIDNHILNIDYENNLAFDTTYIVGEKSASTAAIGESLLGQMRLGTL